MHFDFLKTKLICVFLINCSFASAFNRIDLVETVKTDIKGISGSIPIELNKIIKKINALTDVEIKNGFRNKLILHGVPGNGKTTYAIKIAEATNSELIKIKGSEIITEFSGSGSKAIKQAFNTALDIISRENKRVVIFIDEIDAIATQVNVSKHPMMAERSSTAQTLWQWLEDVKLNSKI